MKFDELDQKMRVYETAHDECILPGLTIVARLDGRNFTRLTKETGRFAVPFDERFRVLMVETTRHLMQCGFRIAYAYTESDEISLLFEHDENTFGRKARKIHSILAGEASAKFSLLLGDVATFDCRTSLLPTEQLVVDYFRWRNEDAHRNALNAYCYWAHREDGLSAQQATRELDGLSVAAKNEFLFQRGTNFNDIPLWQRRGVGLWWETYEKTGANAVTGEATVATRRRIATELELPMRDAYSDFVRERVRGVELA